MKIDMMIECPYCAGTGIFSGMGEGENVAVICNKCKGTGQFHYAYDYNEFTGRKIKPGIERVYLDGYGYRIGTGIIKFDRNAEVDMDKEGVSYDEFLSGKMPKHIETLACPMMADQGACHEIKGFVNRCNELSGHYFSRITDCTYQRNKSLCWKRFYWKRFYESKRNDKIQNMANDIIAEI